MTIQKLLNEWLETYQKGHIKTRTYSRYKGLMEQHIIPAIGSFQIEDLGRREIQKFLLQERDNGNKRSGEKLSASSINIMLTVLNLAFEYACDMEYIPENPCIHVRRTPSERSSSEAFSVKEQRALESEIEASGDKRLVGILLCLYTGLRIGEVLGLMWDDVDLEHGIICINKTVYRAKDQNGSWQLRVDSPKTKSSIRMIPLPEYITQHLIHYKEYAVSPYVVETKKGERMPIRSYQYIFEKLAEQAGVRKLNFHALRHTFATRAIECGMDVKVIAEILGHKNASITLNRYAHCMLDHKIEMMHKLPRVL